MDFKQQLRSAILDESSFVEATFKDAQRGHELPWQRVELRPVLLKNGRHVQFSHYTATQHVAKNYAGRELETELDTLLALPFKNWHVLTTNGRLRVQITKKGKAIIHREDVPDSIELPVMEHDRAKETLLPADRPVPFLQATGIMSQKGRVKANMQRKFRQINQFLQLVTATVDFDALTPPLRVVDFGCGNAYLTFAVYHHLHETLGLPTRLDGVDAKTHLMDRHNRTARDLGWTDVRFHAARIEEFTLDTTPDIVLALHACDTATDDALAQGIRSGSRYIFSAPCCHHHLQAQLDARPAPRPFGPVLGHGILKERLGDVLTDTFRAQLLRMHGYQTDVIEFIATEHTPKNLMIRAVKVADGGKPAFTTDYEALKQFWQVTPHLETLLAK